ncbi:tyrosine-type recombinase/integrase [Bacillus sp. FSL R12-0069]|uniref:tyrosine-type recombinase/integrase n=1 Tax=Bacillus sp. FSL R12-0069 TaxID=2975342 RepID=UPI0030F504D5
MVQEKLFPVSNLIDYNPSDLRCDFRCGNNMFSDDVWDFKGIVEAPHWNDAKFKLNFEVFPSPSIRETVKWYLASELLMNAFSSVRRKLDAFKTLRNYLEMNSDITSFTNFTKHSLRDFFKYVLNAKTEAEKPLSAVSKKIAAQVVKELLIRGGARGWEVPKDTSYINGLYQTTIIDNKEIKEGTKFGSTNKVLPERDIIDKLIKLSLDALENDTDILAAASILLTSQLGCRISENLSIKTGCLNVIDDEFFITYTTSKTGKEPVEVTKPANEVVVTTIEKLEKYSLPLRQESGLPNLFLTRYRTKKNLPVCLASSPNWTKNRLMPFIKKHDLRDETGNLLRLSSHYFRHIFATYALKSGMKIYDVAEMMNHKSILMTQTYDHTKGQKQQIIKEILSGEVSVASTNQITLESIEGCENPFKGLTVDQADKMRRAMKIELLPHGMCLHHPMRGEPCEQDGVCLGCNNFLASANHLPIYERRLEKVNEELTSQPNDKSIYNTKLNYQKGKLENYVQELKRKLVEKEFQQTISEVAVSKND